MALLLRLYFLAFSVTRRRKSATGRMDLERALIRIIGVLVRPRVARVVGREKPVYLMAFALAAPSAP